MEAPMDVPYVLIATLLLLLLGFLFWRYVWFFRNPRRTPPCEEGVLSPADGTVVYVKKVEPHEDVITIKQGVKAKLGEILREDVVQPKLLIGVFMSPFNVHYNRAPVSGEVEFVRHHPDSGRNLHMGRMHLRTLLRREPYYENSLHIVRNERTVTKIKGRYRGKALPCYIVQIAARSVAGIESYVQPGERVERGAVFGMIRIGSQVDIVVSWVEGMRVRAQPGDKVRAGETVLVG